MRIVMLVTTTYTSDSRVRRAAERLALEGHRVHVVCTADSVAKMTPEEFPGPVWVHRVGMRPQAVAVLLLLRARSVLGRRDVTRPQSLHTDRRPRIRPRLATLLRGVASPILLASRMVMSRRMLNAARALRPDCVHAHDPDTLAAAGALSRDGVHLIYDSHELATGRADIFCWERWLDARQERRWIPHSACVIAVSPGIVDILANRHSITPMLIRNVPADTSPSEPPYNLREVTAIPDEAMVVLYQGQRSPGRGLPNLVRAISLLDNTHLVLIGSSVRGIDSEIQRLAYSIGIADRLHFLPSVPSNRLLSLTLQADVGVVLLENISLNYRLALPNKLFEYLQAGVPVVASDLPEIRRVVEDCGGGTLCDASSPEAIATALATTPSPPEASRIPTARRELQQLVDFYCRLNQQCGPDYGTPL